MESLRPRLALTLGDVAGIGPEVLARSWMPAPDRPSLTDLARPFAVGHPEVLKRALNLVGARASVRVAASAEEAAALAGPETIPCLVAGPAEAADVPAGVIDARSGRAAYDALITAIDLALAGEIDGIVTLPLQKEALHAAGIRHPGHTEILAERCGVRDHAMMLYLAPGTAGPHGLGVVHATLHVALRQVFDLLTPETIGAAITLADEGVRPLLDGRHPRIGVAALNPHAGEHGLFGDEEARILAPAVEMARDRGLNVEGPVAADTLFRRALDGAFDAVVAMYHDQGHVALKTLGFHRAVNVTLGLPIVRTSVAHGTAYDIAWRGQADPTSLIEAVRVAARLIAAPRRGDVTNGPLRLQG